MNRIVQRAALIGGLVLMLAVVTGLSQEAATGIGPTTRPSGSATCVLRIATNSLDVPLTCDEMVEGLLRSNGVLREAAGEVGIQTDQLNDKDFIHVSFGQSQLGRVGVRATNIAGMFAITLNSDKAGMNELAGRLMTAMCKRLSETLAESAESERAHLQAQLATAEKAVAEAQQRLAVIHAVQQQLCDAAGQSHLARDAVLAAGIAAEAQLRDIDTKLTGLHARQKALAEQIARIGLEAEKTAASDAVAVELEKVVKFREAEVETARARVKAAVVSAQEGNVSEERLAEARAELARQRQLANANAGGNLLSDLNKEVLMLAVDIAEAEARREFISKQLAEARGKKLLELADRYEREVEIPLHAARSAAERATRDLEDIRARVQEYRPPTVTILGGAAAQ